MSIEQHEIGQLTRNVGPAVVKILMEQTENVTDGVEILINVMASLQTALQADGNAEAAAYVVERVEALLVYLKTGEGAVAHMHDPRH